METSEESDLKGVVEVGVLHLQGAVGFRKEEVAALQQEEVEVEEEEEVELLLQERFA